MQTIRTEMSGIYPSQYTNYDFNSMCVFRGIVIGASSSGLCVLGKGDTDNGSQINAYVIPVESSLGDPAHRKRINEVYLSGRFNSRMSLILTADGANTGGPYSMEYQPDKKVQTRRVDTGRGLEFSYIKMKIANVGGGWFAIDSVQIDVKARKRARR